MVQIHELQPQNRPKRKKRVGRGGKRGTYSGHGQKGQRSRAGAKIRPMERELILRMPKRRGLGFVRHKTALSYSVTVDLKDILQRFISEENVSPKSLLQAGLISRSRGKMPRVKIIGNANVSKRFVVMNCAISANAKAAIEAAGGEIRK